MKALIAALFLLGAASAGAQQPKTICPLDSFEDYPPTRREIEAGESTAATRDLVVREFRLHVDPVEPDLPSWRSAIPIEWADARRMILSGYVVSISQDHSRKVAIKTDRGSSFATMEPKLDEVVVVASVVDPCRRFIRIFTE
jgi:hypothetical protein